MRKRTTFYKVETTTEQTHWSPTQLITVQWFPKWAMAHKIASYAYDISEWDLDFLYTIGSENWTFDMYRRSWIIWANWYYDYGICQINNWYHPHIVNTKEFWESREFQVEKCWELYKWWTRFYWYDTRHKVANRFTIN